MEQIKLNTIPSGVPSVCHISQFDNTSRIIRCHLFNDADPLTLTGSETIRLFVRKSNNSRAEFEIESTSGTFIDLVITSEMSDIAGDSECKFQITDSEKTIGTLNFKMIVEPDAYGDSLKTRSISGPIATFETDLAEDLIKLDVDLEPIQDLHGYDGPWPAGGGDNVMSLSSNNKSDTVFGVTYSYDAETGKITLSGTNNNTTAHGLVGFKPLEDGLITPIFQVGETYTLSVYLPLNTMYCQFTYKNTNNTTRAMAYKRGTGSFSSITFTVPDDFVELIQFIIYVDGTATTLSGEIYFELVKGSTAPTSYTPYSNICPISGHDSAVLYRTGKNLISHEGTMLDQTVYSWGSNDSVLVSYLNRLQPGTYRCSFKCRVLQMQPGKTSGNYGMILRAIRKNGSQFNIQLREMKSNVSVGSVFEFSSTITLTSSEAGLFSNAYYYTGRAYNDGNPDYCEMYDFQIELGSTATDYEPYESDPTPVTVQFGQTVYGGTLDSASSVLRVDTCYMVFDGTQEIGLVNWRPLNNSVGWLYRPNITPNIKNYVVDESNLPYCKLKSDRLQTVVYGGAQGLYGKDSPCISLVGTEYWAIGMRVNDPSLTSATAINNWLSQNPIEVVYELAEPIEIPLSAISPISALVGTNNVYSDAGDVEVEYYTTI